ncbi:hypothetical protein AXF42_Ash021400 [Apostasia shenzhenica]|uniref:RNase H type-1 domain-containing protein n=1 Tax=Apostasia shenzhenica TaxID=1088818 RepID=A0A2H9ZZW4_9ASPA|nr:hypothetical protein AXF42_Ash021400 [Apostasia shenzhenica]
MVFHINNSQPVADRAWTRPRHGFIKINSAGLLLDDQAVGGGIARDHDGNFLFAFHCELDARDNICVEVHSCLFGLQKGISRGFHSIHLEVWTLLQIMGLDAWAFPDFRAFEGPPNFLWVLKPIHFLSIMWAWPARITKLPAPWRRAFPDPSAPQTSGGPGEPRLGRLLYCLCVLLPSDAPAALLSLFVQVSSAVVPHLSEEE